MKYWICYSTYYSSLTKPSTPFFPAAILSDKATTRAGKPVDENTKTTTKTNKKYETKKRQTKKFKKTKKLKVKCFFMTKSIIAYAEA